MIEHNNDGNMSRIIKPIARNKIKMSIISWKVSISTTIEYSKITVIGIDAMNRILMLSQQHQWGSYHDEWRVNIQQGKCYIVGSRYRRGLKLSFLPRNFEKILRVAKN